MPKEENDFSWFFFIFFSIFSNYLRKNSHYENLYHNANFAISFYSCDDIMSQD